MAPNPEGMKWLWRFFYAIVACAVANVVLFLSPIPALIWVAVNIAFLIAFLVCAVILLITIKKEGFFEKVQVPVLNFMMILIIVLFTDMAKSSGILYGTILLAGIWGLILSVLFYGIVRK
jgi:hypothetical protein